jgi:predicted GNAT superfamily acetyltransferase
MSTEVEIRECTTLGELAECVDLQRAAFSLPEVELSPVRHFIVTRNAGGFTLGAFIDGSLAGFVLSVPAFLRGEQAFYSHMTAVLPQFQGLGIGARLKWAQRERALAAGVRFIKWTFEPVKARNAHFNLEKLGAAVRHYERNFYGVDYASAEGHGLASDRLFAEWDLESPKVKALAAGHSFREPDPPVRRIEIMDDWNGLVATSPETALGEQLRIRSEFEQAIAEGLVARGFRRGTEEVSPAYLLFAQ